MIPRNFVPQNVHENRAYSEWQKKEERKTHENTLVNVIEMSSQNEYGERWCIIKILWVSVDVLTVTCYV